MEPTMNLIPTPVDGGVHADEMTKLPLASPHNSEKEDGVDLGHERATESESNEAIDTENGSESADKNQSPETVVDVVRARESETEPDSLDDDVEIVIKNQHKYYIYCPCCGEDITKTVKLVKKSDLQPTKTRDTENEATDTKNGSRFKDKKIKFPSWFPVNLQHLFHYHIDKGKKEVDLKSPTVSSIDLGIDDKEQSVNVKFEFERPSFPKWYLDIFAWLFLCIIIALSVLFTSPQQSPSVLSTSPQPFILPHPQLPSVSSLQLPSASVLLLLPTFAVLFLVILAMRTRYGPRFQKEKGDKSIDSKSSDTASEEQSRKTQYQDDQTADPGQEADKKTVHPAPLDTSPHEQPSMQIVNKETHENAESETPAKTQTEPELQSNTQLEIPNSLEEPHKGGTTLEILKSIVYGGLTESITSLCTVTSAAASGASTLNIFALGVANLSSGLLLIFHNLQELINEKPRKRTNNIDDQTNSEEERDRYEEILGRREKSKLHSFIAISSFFVCGMIPPLVYCFSFRQRFEKRQEYKTLAVYGVSLVCVVLLSIAKAYVSKRREYLKTLFRYTAMATTASGLSQFVGYLVSRWLEKSGFYDDSPQTTPRV